MIEFMWIYQQRKLNSETEEDKKPPPKPDECPHCNDCKGNTDPSRLRLHVGVRVYVLAILFPSNSLGKWSSR